ncbi:hypothetical protein [uncultured Eubacterium sp.]|uniref:hypothetical protein n=1 Tax=uncultured Eubacterium sp. TaxID=165185 RepID=UPI0025DA4678|nr:hypothetical protein [uncultured Eubacterium sp.]
MKSKIIIGSLTVTSSIIAAIYIAYICLTYNDMLTAVPLRMFIEIAVIGWIIFNAMVLLISHIIKKRK